MANSDMMHKVEQKLRQQNQAAADDAFNGEDVMDEATDPFELWNENIADMSESKSVKKKSGPVPKKPSVLTDGPVLAPTSRAGIRHRVNAGKSSGKVSIVRDIPRGILTEMFREFPQARNQTDVLVAYTICHSPGSLLDKVYMDLTQDQLDLIDSWDGNAFKGIEEKLDKLAPIVQNIHGLVKVLEVLSAYMTYDRLGFRTGDPLTVDDVNLNEDNLLDFLVKLEGQSNAIQRDKDLIIGRK